MKPLLKTAIAALFCTSMHSAMAQIDALKILANGNVGISNENPTAQLHVGGPMNGSAMSTTFITNAGSLGKAFQNELPLGSIGFTSSNNRIALGIRAFRTISTADSGWGTTAIGLGMDVDNNIRVNNGSLWFSSNGGIGIGNATPAARLHVGAPLNGTAMSSTFITNAGSLGKGYQSELSLASIGFTSAANKVALGIRALRSVNNTDSGWNTTAIGLGMETDNTTRASGAWLWLSANGRVGIGTATPQKALDIMAEGGIRISRTEGIDNTPSKNEIYFQDNGQIRSSDNNHRLIFNRSNNTMELREFGDIVFSAGTNGDNGTQAMIVKANGNVGIGIPNPGANLQIVNMVNPVNFTLGSTDNGYTSLITRLSSVKDGYAYIQAIKAQGTAWGNLILNKGGGWVGIGTTTPIAPLHVSGQVANEFTLGSYLDGNGASGKVDKTRNDLYHSIIADGRVRAAAYDVVSDARIKNIIGHSDGAKDLTTLMGISITDYQYKDVTGRGNNQYKKVIAQQVETVFPQAVGKTTDVVPDIYKKASFKNGWVYLINDLKYGERVKLITGNEATVYEVLEAKNNMFRIDCKYTGNEVFVYGREVKDFRIVDYEAISMLNVSATQELVKLLEALKKDNVDMKKRLEALEAKGKKTEPAITDNVVTLRKDS